jgi:hypothetical protein
MCSRPEQLRRKVLVSSLALSPEIPVSVSPGEATSFAFDVVGELRLPYGRRRLQVRASDGCPVYSCVAVPMLYRRDAADDHFVLAPVEFSTETKQNTLDAAVWHRLFPSDVREEPSILVPLLGRILWRRLVTEGKLREDAPIIAIDVETQEYRVFEDMVAGLRWAQSLEKPTVYFREFEPGSWRVGLRETEGHED